MKKALSLIVYYVCILAAFCAGGVFIYYHYFNCVSLAAGSPTRTVSAAALVYGFFETLPVLFLLMGLGLQLYTARHLDGGVPYMVTYALLGVLTWALLFPVAIAGKEKVYSVFEIEKKTDIPVPLTGGYFRRIGGAALPPNSLNQTVTKDKFLYYFIRDERDGTADTLAIDLSAAGEQTGRAETLDVSEQSELRRAAAPFQDPLVKDALPDIPYGLIRIFSLLKKQAQDAWRGGIFSWLCFCALGFALFSTVGFVQISSWRMINIFAVIFMNGIVFFFNTVYFSDEMEFLRTMPAALEESLSQIRKVCAEPALMLFNIAAGILFICAGCVFAALRRSKAEL